MKATTLIAALVSLPAALAAQVSGSTAASGSARATTAGSTDASVAAHSRASVNVPAGYSAESKAKIEGAFKAAREKNLPEEPMRHRLAEGEAKGASDTRVAAAVQKAEARLEASQSAMVKAGRANPEPREVVAGEQAMERGATEAQIEALVRHAPADRSLTVALNVLSKLEATGTPAGAAVAQVESKLDAHASDGAISALLGSSVGGSLAAPVTGVSGGLGGTLSGAVNGALGGKKP